VLVGRANLLRVMGLRGTPIGGRDLRRSRGRATDEDDFEAPARRVVVRNRQEPAFDRPQPRVRVATPPVPIFPDEDDADDMDGDIPSSYAPAPQPQPKARRVAQPAPVLDPDYRPPDDYDDEIPDYEPVVSERPARAPLQKTEPTGGLVGNGERRIAVGAQPRQIVQEKRPGGRMEAQGGAPQGYQMPSLNFLSEPRRLGPNEELSEEVLEGNAGTLEGVLDDFGIKGEICHVRPGPVVTLYELEPAAGVKSSRVIGLADDIARSMSAISARVAVVPGRNVIGIELPNQRRETVYLRELLASQEFGGTKHKLALCLGKTIGGEPVIVDLARMPHLLVAGTTGSGKSVAINTMILSLLYRLTPQQCKLIMIDPKMLELSVYDNIPHLLCPVVTDPKKAVVALKWSVREMEDRYKKMSKLGVRNIDGFNARVSEANARGEILTREIQTGFHRLTGEPVFEQEELALEPLPYIVVIVDEMADLMLVAGKEIEGAIQRLAQMARAAGIHIVMATQRPSVDVITGTIKANFPTRISFQVTSKIDSRTILAEQGAEQLLGQGDMLYMAGGGRIQRVHGPFVSDDEVEKVVAHLKKQGAPQYLDAITAGDEEDVAGDGDAGGMDESTDLYDKAVAVVLRDKKPSTSYVQRRLQVGYNKAASLIERMEKEGIVSAPNQQGKREILVGGG
jgi:S-DNA-T family DNA segregation ATPase FtsK/SpoIIIE